MDNYRVLFEFLHKFVTMSEEEFEEYIKSGRRKEQTVVAEPTPVDGTGAVSGPPVQQPAAGAPVPQPASPFPVTP